MKIKAAQMGLYRTVTGKSPLQFPLRVCALRSEMIRFVAGAIRLEVERGQV